MSTETIHIRTVADLHTAEHQLSPLLDTDPAEAVRQARLISIEGPLRPSAMTIRGAILVDGGEAIAQPEAVEEGLQLLREAYRCAPNVGVLYNIANALVASVRASPAAADWLDHQEAKRDRSTEARGHYWCIARDEGADENTRTQAWTNLANLLTSSYRLGEAHDARLAALAIDPSNGVAAGAAARDLMWLYQQGGCSDLTRIEAAMLAKVAEDNGARIRSLAGADAAEQLTALAETLGDVEPRPPHRDPFVRWVERERLTLAPAVELVDPALGKLDWLMLPPIGEHIRHAIGGPPPIIAMFNSLKADYVLARDLAWRAIDDDEGDAWPKTARFASTLDGASYGPNASALVLAHCTALDLLDKVAVAANYHFRLGQPPDRVAFGRLWRRPPGKKQGAGTLIGLLAKAIRDGAYALYALVELADDHAVESGILHPQKDLRNEGTHRFVVLHEFGDPSSARSTLEITRRPREQFIDDLLRALRVARSALQMLALAIGQQQRAREASSEDRLTGVELLPDHDG